MTCVKETTYNGPVVLLVTTERRLPLEADLVERLYEELKAHGFNLVMVVADGSSIYLTVLMHIWSQAKHFHLAQHVTDTALKVIRQLHTY